MFITDQKKPSKPTDARGSPVARLLSGVYDGRAGLLQCGYGRVGAHSIGLPAQAQPEDFISGRRQTRMSAREGRPSIVVGGGPPCA